MAKPGTSTQVALPEKQFEFVGGDLSLDFCNTVGGKRGLVEKEFLKGYLDFLSWASQAQLVQSAQVATLAGRAAERPSEAAAVLERARRLREAIYRMMMARREGKTPAESDLEELNRELAANLCRLRVARQGKNQFGWEWASEAVALEQPLGPVARAAAELLIQNERCCRVRQCHADNCGWLFLDCSKNHSRCWCTMRDCGNRAKVRRHRMKSQNQSH